MRIKLVIFASAIIIIAGFALLIIYAEGNNEENSAEERTLAPETGVWGKGRAVDDENRGGGYQGGRANRL